MGTLSHSESRHSYSWLWDSHIPKNSKWLQENLKDMDGKVKTMIKLIEEDADSFARRAEMYYKKRPELMKLVEEFYRAYRALAERYDHAVFELRHAHRTMAAAFPNHVPYAVADDTGSSTGEVEPHTPEMTHPIRAFFDSDDFHKDDEGLSSRRISDVNSEDSDSGISRKSVNRSNMKNGQKVKATEQYSEDGGSQMLSENEDLKAQVLSESERAGKAETEVQTLKRTLTSIESEKNAILLQYNEGLKKLSSLELKLSEAENDASVLNEKACRAEIEIKVLKEALTKLEAEKDASLLQYSHSSEKISDLENTLHEAQDDVKGLNWKAFKAETEATMLKLQLSALAAEKETGLAQYKKSLQMISALENKIVLAEENSRILNEQTERAENEVGALKEALTKLNEEKDDIAGRYEKCLETITKMEIEISCAQEDAKRLNDEILSGSEQLKSVEGHRRLLETSNQSLQKEANNLMQKIAIKDQQLSEKQNELEKLQTSLIQEQSRFLQVEASLETLRKLHSQSQEEQKNLGLDLQNRLQRLKELESSNQNLEESIQQVREENQNLNELNKSSADSVKHLQDEIFTLKELKDKLENEVALQIGQVTNLQQEMCKLTEEIKNLNQVYLELLRQLQSAGLDPECIEASLRHLKEENASLKEACDRYASEKETLLTKMREMDTFVEKNAELRCSLSELNGKMEGSREVVQELQKSCHFYQDEKSSLVLEKAIILSQLQITTQTMQNMLEKNSALESSLSGANTELEGLRTKSKSLDELCQLLKNEKFILQSERDALACQLENVEEKMASLEKRFARLEERYSELEKEKESSIFQVKELKGSLSAEQQLHICYVQATESRFTNLEKHVHDLQEENSLRKKDFEEELEKTTRAQVEIHILQKFIKDLEEKNLSLLIECENHAEDSKITDQLIRELESENLELQIETEFLLDDIQKLRVGIRRVSLALQFEAPDEKNDVIETDQIPIPQIMDRVKALKSYVLSTEDEKHQLLIENSVLLTLLRQLKSDSYELELKKGLIEQEVTILKKQNAVLQEEKGNMEELNEQVTWEVNLGKLEARELYSELETRDLQLVNLESSCQVLQEEKSKRIEENKVLLDKLSNLKDDMKILEEQNKAALQEAISFSSLSVILESFSTEKSNEVKSLVEDVQTLRTINRDLNAKIKDLGDQLEREQAEATHLNRTVGKLQGELTPFKEMNDQLSHQIVFMKEFLKEKMMETVEVNHQLKAAYILNSELSRTVEDLKTECQESKRMREILEMQLHELSMDSREHEREIKSLQEVNRNFESEISLLEAAIEEQKTREENLSSEMVEKNNEFELWDAEASSFYFDFQVSSICEVLLQSKVQELTGACENLEDENSAQSMKIEEMKEQVNVLESQIDGLKVHLSSYIPAIASLRDCVTSLEHNALARAKLCDSRNKNKENFDMSGSFLEVSCEELEGKGSATGIAVIGDLQDMQTRIKAVEKTIVDEIDEVAAHDFNKRNNVKVSAHYPVPEPDASSLCNRKMQQKDQITEKPMSRKMKVDISETKSETLMKDILLDQVSGSSFDGRSSRREKGTSNDEMLELWESVDKGSGPEIALNGKKKRLTPLVASGRFRDAKHKTNRDIECGVNKVDTPSITTEAKQGARGRKVLERLASDADKLTNLHITIQELRKKVEMNKSSKRTNDHEFRRVKGQLEEVEEAIQELWNMNGQLQVDFQSDSGEQEEAESTQKKRVAEEAQKGSEKIGRLQVEVQSIQYILVRLENERKNKEKTKFGGAMLRDFIYTGPREVRKAESKKKSRACWCARPRTPEHFG